MIDWLIIGGGPQGRFVAQAIRAAAPDADLAVLDSQPILAAWRRRADACGMSFLRSSGAHHLGQQSGDLRRFAAAHDYDARHWLGYYRRPSRALFEAHGHEALAGLVALKGHATAIDHEPRGWRVHTADGACYRATRVVLALGPNTPYRPAWGTNAEHVYDPDFRWQTAGDRIAVVGGGITGAQLALRFHAAGRHVCWVTRSAPRPADFDSDPCYAGPRCLAPFARASLDQRRELLAAARRPGTLPSDVMAQISAALAAGTMIWRQGDIADLDDAGAVFSDGRRLDADRVVLATGFDRLPAADSLLGRCIAARHLSIDRDGHIAINANLEAAPGLHLIGHPASLQLGPMAGNIQGARLAAKRLAPIAAGRSTRIARPA